MNGNIFDRYAGLKENVSPLTDDILSACVANSSCEACPARANCPIRLIVFSLDDKMFECFVKMAENQTAMSHAGMVPEDATREMIRGITEKIVAKRNAEKKSNEEREDT